MFIDTIEHITVTQEIIDGSNPKDDSNNCIARAIRKHSRRYLSVSATPDRIIIHTDEHTTTLKCDVYLRIWIARQAVNSGYYKPTDWTPPRHFTLVLNHAFGIAQMAKEKRKKRVKKSG